MRYDICVFGGCALDQMYYKDEFGNVPEKPSLLVPGGKGANQAVAASRAGAKVAMISRLGKDSIGDKILDNLIYNNVITSYIDVVEDLPNDYADIVIDNKNKDNNITRFAGAIDSFTVDMIENNSSVLLNSKMVVAQLKVPKEVTVELINFCYDNKLPLVITPCRPKKLVISEDNNAELIDKISYITCNKEECMTIFETDDIEACVTKYPNKLIVTLGEDGLMYHDGTSIVHLPALYIREVEETTGGGDTFNGNFAANLVAGESLYNSIIRAQYASAMKIRVKTAQEGMPFKDELDNFIMNYYLEENDYSKEFELAYTAIVDSYDLIKKQDIMNVRMKADDTFVTQSDLMVEKHIIDSIVNIFPEDNFVTEEFNNNNTVKDRTWVIDPIDGTHHYMKNSIFWGIQLAFVDKGQTRFSIIYLPKLDEMFYAIKDKGVFLNHHKIEKQPLKTSKESIVEFCGSVHKKYTLKKFILERMLNSGNKPGNFMHINSCCFAFSNLLTGRTDTLVVSTKSVWDVLPGMFMVEELGFKKIEVNDIVIYTNTKNIIDLLLKKA